MATIAGRVSRAFGQLFFWGPIFGKEMRTAARRKRNYALRALYVLVLTVLVMLVWYATVDSMRYSSMTVSRMSRVGLELLMTIGIFQFVALQIISPVLTSTAISDEISHSTLGVLMMTPITSLQIVTGKLFSKLLTMILLVCASLPLLAMIRIFGGIEWRAVWALVALTLCASIFAASISLAFSIFHKKAYAAIIMTYVTLVAIYLLGPMLLAIVFEGSLYNGDDFFSYFNPFMSMGWVVDQMENPGLRAAPGWLAPPVQCALLLAATLGMVLVSAVFVRRVALRMASGESAFRLKRKTSKPIVNAAMAESDLREKLNVRPVSDRPILWRELHMPLMGTKRRRAILIGFTLLAMVFTYGHTWRGINWDETHVLYTFTYMLLTLIGAAILSATTISSERESSTWQALLTTPLTAREIVFGKVVGVLKRLFPIAVLYVVHIVLFTALNKINTLALLYMVPLLVGPVVFLVGTGTLISSKVKHTTTAVMLNLGAGIFVWVILPILGGVVGMMTRRSDELFESMLKINPLVLNFVCFDRISGSHQAARAWSALAFDWPEDPNLPVGGFSVILAVITGAYIVAGVFMTEWAIFRIAREKQ